MVELKRQLEFACLNYKLTHKNLTRKTSHTNGAWEFCPIKYTMVHFQQNPHLHGTMSRCWNTLLVVPPTSHAEYDYARPIKRYIGPPIWVTPVQFLPSFTSVYSAEVSLKESVEQ